MPKETQMMTGYRIMNPKQLASTENILDLLLPRHGNHIISQQGVIPAPYDDLKRDTYLPSIMTQYAVIDWFKNKPAFAGCSMCQKIKPKVQTVTGFNYCPDCLGKMSIFFMEEIND